MWTKLQTLMRQINGESEREDAFDPFQLALAGLLVHVAAIDGHYHDDEHEKLKTTLRQHFDLEPGIASRLLKAGHAREEVAVDIYTFTRVLAKELDQPGRQEVVEMLWEIAFADGDVHEYEGNLVWRASELLGVSRADRLRLRDKVRLRRPGRGPE